MSIKLAADGSTTVDKANDTMIDKVIHSVTAPFSGDDIYHSSAEMMAAAITYGAGGLVAGSIFTRKRVAQNKPPIGGFIL